MDVAQFRQNFPEFADVNRYPNSSIIFWSGIGERMTSSERYGDLYDFAVQLFTAHHVTLGSLNMGNPGASGLVASKAVGSVNVSYDNASLSPTASHWNQTSYGRQYLNLSKLIGAGCVQL